MPLSCLIVVVGVQVCISMTSIAIQLHTKIILFSSRAKVCAVAYYQNKYITLVYLIIHMLGYSMCNYIIYVLGTFFVAD